MANYRDSVSSIISWGHWFTFFNIIIAIVQSARYVLDAGYPTTVSGNLFLFTYTMGHFGFLFFATFVLLLFPLAFIFPFFRAYRTLAIILATLGQAALMLDSQFYRELGMHSNSFLYELFIQGEGNGVGTEWWKVALAFAILLLLEISLANWVSQWRDSRSRRQMGKRITTLFVICLFTYNLTYAIADAMNYGPITRQATYYPLSYPLTAKTALKKAGFIDSEEDFGDPNQPIDYDGSFNYPKTLINPRAVDNPPNIVWVVISGLNAEMLNVNNMPMTLAQARKGLWAVNHYSGGNNVRDGIFTLLYGIPASYSYEALYSHTPPYFVKFLREQGYHSHTFSSLLNMDPQNRVTLLKSFDSLWIPNNITNPALTDIQAVHNWQQTFVEQDLPGFYLLQLNSVLNFATPPGFENPFKPDLEGVIFMDENSQPDPMMLKNRYQNAVLHMDQLLHQIYKSIENTNTLLLVTSDYGQTFSELADSTDKDEDFRPERMRVPLLMMGPGIDGNLVNSLSSHLDVVPTFMSQIAINAPKSRTYSSGFNMLDGEFSRDWLLMGNSKAFSVKEPTQQVVVKKYGEYTVRDNDYRPLPDNQLNTAPLVEAVREMRRFVR